jgi:spermidine synthase
VGTLGASIYAFACVLAAFLLGIGFGPWVFPAAGDPRSGSERLSLDQHCAVAGLFVGIFVLTRVLGIEGFLGTGRNRTPSLGGAGALFVYQFLLCCVALLPATLFFGAAFPAAIRSLSPDAASAPAAAGAAYAWNTLGAIAGTSLAAFVGLPFLGLRGSLALSAAATAAAAFAALFPSSPARPSARRKGALLAAALLPVGAALLLPAPRDPPHLRTILAEEGASASVAVEETTGPGGEAFRTLRVDGKVVATSAFLDRRLQRLLGHLAALAHPAPARALTVGLGTGMTAGAVSSHPEVERATVVEIAPPVVRGARLFSGENHGVLDRVTLRLEDGRSFLLGTKDRFDLVTTDPIHPWTAGSGNLYTTEYFELARSRLAPGGVVGQWIPLYEVSTEDVRSIAATFAAVFPEVALFLTAYDLVLLGSEPPIRFDVEAVERRMRHPAVRASLADVSIDGVADLFATFVAGTQAVREYARDGRINRDDRPFVEYSAPRSVLARYSLDVLFWIRERGTRAEEIPLRGASPSLLGAIEARLRARDAALGRFIEDSPSNFPEAAASYARALRKSQ